MKQLIKSQKKIIFEKITGDEGQIKVLYSLIKSRKHNISNQILPSLTKHSEFVKSHPYRAWYLLRLNKDYLGTVYLLKNNSIGFTSNKQNEWILTQSLNFILEKYEPLKEIKALRPPYFFMNIPITNKKLIEHMNKSGAIQIQLTYNLEKFQQS
jgi:hypothetical protein